MEQLKQYIHKKQAMVMKDENLIIVQWHLIMKQGVLSFWGYTPQYRKKDISKAFMYKALDDLLKEAPISITTFRAGDKADPGYRKIFQNLGFAEAELLTVFVSLAFILKNRKVYGYL